MKESDIQASICAYLSTIARRCGFLYFSVPNEGFLTAATMGSMGKPSVMRLLTTLRKMGMTPGVSDLIIGCKGRMYAMEVKSETGTQSDNQITFENWCTDCGIPYAVVRSVQDAEITLKEWGVMV